MMDNGQVPDATPAPRIPDHTPGHSSGGQPVFTRIQARNFRSLLYVDQPLRDFQVIVGPNGAGKSSFLDVIALLGDILTAGPLRAFVGDASRGVAPRAGNPRDVAWLQSPLIELAVELRIPDELRNSGSYTHARYEVGIDVGGTRESLALSHETLYLIPDRQIVQSAPEMFPSTVRPPSTLQRPVEFAARDEHGATDIVPGNLHPRLRDWQQSSDLGTLFAAGVLGRHESSAASRGGND